MACPRQTTLNGAKRVRRAHSSIRLLRGRPQKPPFYHVSGVVWSQRQHNRFERVVFVKFRERERESRHILVARVVRAHARARHSARVRLRARRKMITSTSSRALARGRDRAAMCISVNLHFITLLHCKFSLMPTRDRLGSSGGPPRRHSYSS